MVDNIQAPPFKPVDHVSEGQLPGTFAYASAPIDPSKDNYHSLIQGPGSNSTDAPDGKGEERLDSLGQASGKTETNQHNNLSILDHLTPIILFGLGALLVGGVVKSFKNQNKNKQPETRTEVHELPNPRLNVNEKKETSASFTLRGKTPR